MKPELTDHQVMGLLKAHSLANQQIPGIRLVEILIHRDGSLWDERVFACLGHCNKCDSYFRTLLKGAGTIIEVVHVGYTKPTTPA